MRKGLEERGEAIEVGLAKSWDAFGGRKGPKGP